MMTATACTIAAGISRWTQIPWRGPTQRSSVWPKAATASIGPNRIWAWSNSTAPRNNNIILDARDDRSPAINFAPFKDPNPNARARGKI